MKNSIQTIFQFAIFYALVLLNGNSCKYLKLALKHSLYQRVFPWPMITNIIDLGN